MDATIRGFPVPKIFDAVGRVERRLDRRGPPPRARSYHRIGYWLVERRLMHRGLLAASAQTGVVPYFVKAGRLKALARFFKEYHLFSRFSAALGAEVLCVRNNVRAFYLDTNSPIAVKVCLCHTRSLDDMRNEIRSRNRVTALATLKIPRLIRHDLEHDPPFLIEEVVFGRRLRSRPDALLVAESICPQLWAFYEKSGIQFQPVSAVIDSRNAAELLEFAVAAFAPGRNWPHQQAFLARAAGLLNGEGRVPVAFGHGDLGFSNLLLQEDGTVWFLDWEQARELPIASDLLRLLVDVPEARAFAAAKLKGLAQSSAAPKLLGFADQFLLAIIDHILVWSRGQAHQRPASAHRPDKLGKYLECAGELAAA